MKPNCYKCKWRRKLVGSAHSKCEHPAAVKGVAQTENQPVLELMAILAGVGRVPSVQMEVGLNVVGNSRGVKKGWFNWPFNFDPVWLENCDGFKNKEEK